MTGLSRRIPAFGAVTLGRERDPGVGARPLCVGASRKPEGMRVPAPLSTIDQRQRSPMARSNTLPTGEGAARPAGSQPAIPALLSDVDQRYRHKAAKSQNPANHGVFPQSREKDEYDRGCDEETYHLGSTRCRIRLVDPIRLGDHVQGEASPRRQVLWSPACCREALGRSELARICAPYRRAVAPRSSRLALSTYNQRSRREA